MAHLINEAKRMQQLAGIKYTNYPTGEEILLEFFIEEYCLKNKILQENLHEGIIQKIKDKLQKLNLNPTEGYIVFLLKKLEAILTKDGYTKVLNIAKNYNGSNNIKQVTNYINKELNTSLDEAILDIFKNKEGNPNVITRFVTIALATVILYMGSVGKKFPTESTIDKFPAQNEKPLTPDELQKYSSDGGFDVPIKTQQILQNISNETDKNIGDDSSKVTTDNNKVKITYGTGDSKIQNDSEISKQIGDEIVKKLNGNIFDPTSKIPIKGLISNLPGEDDDNPNGPSKTGLAKDRLSTGLKLIDSIVKYLTDTYPKQFPDKDALKKSFIDGGTNIGDTGPEVKKNSPEAKSNQATEFDTSKIKSKTTPTPTPTSPSAPDTLTYFRPPGSLLPDSNKYYVILGYILPLITDNKQPSKEVISLISPKENEVINDSFIDKKILELDKLDTKESKQAENILVWARRVKKNPKSIGEYFKSLDPKINVLWQKRILTKPGEKGKAAFVGGSGTTQTPTPGAAAGSILPGAGAQTNLAETSLMKLYSNLLLEATVSEWKSLPDYNDNTAKNNLGTLVPLYVYIWDLNDNGAIEYVASKNSPYTKSWTTFEKNYPIVYRKVSNNLISISDKNKNKLTPDVTRVFTTIDKNSSLVAALKRINRRDELQQLIISITRFVNTNINSRPNDIRTDLFSISNTLKKQVKEEVNQSQPDVEKAIQIINKYTGLKSVLNNINSRKEYIEFMKKFLSYIDPTLFTKRESDIKGALIGAANTITNAGTVSQRQKTK